MNATQPIWVYWPERAVAAAIAELRSTDEAIALANIAAVARREVAAMRSSFATTPHKAARNVCIDAYAQCRQELNDIIFLAAQSQDLERAALPETDAVIDMLSAVEERAFNQERAA